jgi:hypothetical protein
MPRIWRLAICEPKTCFVEARTALSPKYCPSFKMLREMRHVTCDAHNLGFKTLPNKLLPHENVDLAPADEKPAEH